jgi:hypothetical protein
MKWFLLGFLFYAQFAFASAEDLPKTKVECLEICLQERGANNFKTVAKSEKQCLVSTIGHADMRKECSYRKKQTLRNLEFNDVKVCNRKCG